MTSIVRIAVSCPADRAVNLRTYSAGEPTQNLRLDDGDEHELTLYPGQNYQFDEISVEPSVQVNYDPARDPQPVSQAPPTEYPGESPPAEDNPEPLEVQELVEPESEYEVEFTATPSEDEGVSGDADEEEDDPLSGLL